LSAGKSERAWEIGWTRTPSVGAESTTTPRAEAAREQELGQRAAERVAHDDRRALDLLDGLGQVVDGLVHGEVCDEVRVLAQALDLDLEPGVARGHDVESLGFVVGHPVLPAARRHPEAVHEHDRVGCRIGGHRISFSRSVATFSMMSSRVRKRPRMRVREPLASALDATSGTQGAYPSERVIDRLGRAVVLATRDRRRDGLALARAAGGSR
jgi:hypothetical protein